MLALDEFAQRVLAVLEEYGCENIFALLNTIVSPSGQVKEIDDFGDAIAGLLSQNMISLQMEGFVPRNPEKLTDEQAWSLMQSFGRWFKYEESTSFWTCATGDLMQQRVPVVCLSAEGRTCAEAILEDRGYQWWRATSV